MARNNIFYLYPTHDVQPDDREMFPEFYRSQIAPAANVLLPNGAANAELKPIQHEEE